jgi:hypothetical protein
MRGTGANLFFALARLDAEVPREHRIGLRLPPLVFDSRASPVVFYIKVGFSVALDRKP